MPGKPLAIIFRAKVRDELKKAGLFYLVSSLVWKKEWVIDLESVGTAEAAFKYLAPYIIRVAISNNRILKLEQGKVTFKYKESATDRICISTVTARHLLQRARELLSPPASPSANSSTASPDTGSGDSASPKKESPRCSNCGSPLMLVRTLSAKGREPP